jgi:peptidoglycan hydrolase-like protein with peptidoglycan-binding domain
MKKINSTLLLFALILTFLGLSYVASARVGIGSRSEEVKAIQEILKTDSDVYPEGYVTGYYGSLTEKAIKKLQKKCGLPETGEIDDETEKCIYPVGYGIKVTYPNGGEVLDRNQIQTVKWEVIEPEVKIPEIHPFWTKASIDLFKKTGDTSTFVKHIATVNLSDKNHSWKIASDIPNSKDYVIRISLGPGVGSIWYREKTGQSLPSAEEIWPVPPSPNHIYWDESDAPFEIGGEVKPVPNLTEVIGILEKMVTELQKAIALLKGMSQ